MSLQKRLRLRGKPASLIEIAKEVSELILGDKRLRREPQSIPEVARSLGFGSRTTIYRYIAIAEKENFLKLDENGDLIKPQLSQATIWKRFEKKHPITQNKLVSEWKQDLLTRKGGKPVKTWMTRIRKLHVLCNTLKINPEELLVDEKATEKFIKNYLDLYREGKVDQDFQKENSDIQNITYAMAQAIRDFCSYYGLRWKRNCGGVMSQKVPNHAKYGDKRFTNEEIEKADQFIKTKWGLDSDVFRWFWIGVLSGARFTALYNMSLEYEKHVGKTGKITYIMSVIEGKADHIKGGKWIKFIDRPDIQKSIDLLKSRGGKKIFESKLVPQKFRKWISICMKEIYEHVGKTEYFVDHPTHGLRHIGTHYRLAQGNYKNHVIVAKILGWNTVDEMIASYGDIPPEKVLEEMDKI